jgi:hypothetical protein
MFNKALIPIIRKMMPKTIAQDIVGVQPMSMSHVFTMKGDKVGFKNYVMARNQNECVLYDTPDKPHYAVDVRTTVEEWLHEQPIDMWKYAEETDDCHMSFNRYIINEELLTWMTLRWG